MKLVCISDTHGMHRQIEQVPDGDVLIHAGDSLGVGTLEELADLDDWFASLPHRHKILVAGNHDWCFEEQPEAARNLVRNAIYLQDSGVELDRVRFWGSPWTPLFHDWAFNRERGEPIAECWARIPPETDVLITHGPPWGVLDTVRDHLRLVNVGCEELARRLESLPAHTHIFGHIHECHGQKAVDGRLFVNASTCDDWFQPVNPPLVVDIEPVWPGRFA